MNPQRDEDRRTHGSNPADPPQSSLSVVVPCANEEEVLLETNRQLTAALSQLSLSFEVIYVDDGSTDSTPVVLRQLQLADNRVKVLCLSRNFGHQVAITAGMAHAAGDAVVVIDADLQDPPAVIAEFVKSWRKGYDVAYGVRTERQGENAFKRGTAKLFYKIIGRLSSTDIPADTGDFRLMDRKVVDALLSMKEHDRFIRGMVSWLGFSQVAIPYRRAPRLAGKTKYPLVKMIRFATDAILSFSTIPLKIATWFGFLASGMAVVGILLALYARIFEKNWVQGWTSIVIAVLFLGGVQLICLGIIGEYVGRIYGESKRRPLYFVREQMGFKGAKPAVPSDHAEEESEAGAAEGNFHPAQPHPYPSARTSTAKTGEHNLSVVTERKRGDQ